MIDKHRAENGGMIVLLGLVTAGLALVVSSFVSALLWAALAAVLFQPLFSSLLERWPGRRNLAATMTLLIITVSVIIPAFIITSMVIEQASGVYSQLRSGQINFARYFQEVHDALPDRVQNLLGNAGLGTFERVQMRLSEALSNSASTLTQRALSFGANAAAFLLSFSVGLYVTFFFVRDGQELGRQIVKSMPLDPTVSERIGTGFVTVVRATIKGSGLVALAQGTLGAITFWIVGFPAALLWGLLMAIGALLPAIGPAIVWGPVAIYLFAVGEVWQGSVVIASGVFVIGLTDNILRPILVGRDAGIPDWLVLVTTLGGIELLGLSGIVIGPMAGALFIISWRILTEQRLAAAKQIAPSA